MTFSNKQTTERFSDDLHTWLAARKASTVLFLSSAFTSRAIIAGLMKLDSILKTQNVSCYNIPQQRSILDISMGQSLC